MNQIRGRSLAALMVGPLALAAACYNGATEPELPDVPAESVAACLAVLDTLQIQDVGGVSIDLPPAPRPWDTSDAALGAKFAEEDGHGTVAFKERESLRVLDSGGSSGYRAPVSAQAIREGLEMVCGYGSEIHTYLHSMGGAVIRIEPSFAAPVRNHPLVDYLEPRMWAQLATAP